MSSITKAGMALASAAIVLVFAAPLFAGDDSTAAADTAHSLQQSAVSIGDPARFSRVFEKAKRGEPITVGFIGGSITQGFAAHDEAHRYGNLVADWWRQTFPKSTITDINAGIGGTGSNYGCLRVQKDLLSKHPDVVLIEFAVNDDDNKHVAETLEGLVRQVLSAPDSPACMLLFMSHDGQNAQDWHEKVGAHYGLPMVSYRDGLAKEIADGRLTWTDASHDDIHPNDRGHAMAARYVTSMLETLLKKASPSESIAPLPSPLFTDLYQHVDAQDADVLKPIQNSGWTFDATNKCWKADTVGSVIEFEIPGRGVDLMYYRIHKNMGQARVTIDGGHAKTCDAWFSQTWGGFRETADIATDLPPGNHIVRIEIINEKAPQSSGHEFRILGIAGLGLQ